MKKLSLLIVILSAITSFTSCKKEKEDPVTEMPVLNTCQPAQPQAGLTLVKEGEYLFESAGGASIHITESRKTDTTVSLNMTLQYKAFPNLKIVFSAYTFGKEQHSTMKNEYLNGKHIKDRIGANRTIIFPDGTKVTLVAEGPDKAVTAISIYDGANAQHLNTTCFKLEYSASNQEIAKRLDDMQADGEAGTFEITDTGLLFYNIYNEDTPGNKVQQRLELGELFKDEPNKVNDFYDDPRLIST